MFDLTQIETGDVEVNNITMTKINGINTLPIMGQIEGISIYEDLYRPVILADFQVRDGINMLKHFPITGEEYIDVQFLTPSRLIPYKARFFVYAVNDININDENQLTTYTMRCCSEEFFWSCSTLAAKPYLTTIDQMISDILKSYLHSTKPYDFVPANGIQQFICPSMSPFKVIDILTKRASSISKASSSYVFYEDKFGFHFKTLEDLVSQGIGSVTPTYKTYYKYTALRSKFQSELAHWHIKDYRVSQQFNVLDAMTTGAYNGTMQSFDVLTKSISNNTYMATQYNSFTSLDQGGASTLVIPPAGLPILNPIIGSIGNQVRSVSSANFSKYGTTAATNFLNYQDSSRLPTYMEQFLPKKLGYMTPFLTSSYDIWIEGDTDLTVGNVIGINLVKPESETSTPATTPDLLTNGNYLITALRHNVWISALKPKYNIVATISKGTFN